MNRLIIFLVILLSSYFQYCYGQQNNAREKIEAERIALITERLGLTPDQAEKFWPIYNEYNQQRRALLKELQDARGQFDVENMTEEQSRTLMDKTLNIKERQLQLEKQYSRRMNQVITAQQLLSLKRAEEDFRKMILRRLEERRNQQLRREQMRNRREEILKNRRNN